MQPIDFGTSSAPALQHAWNTQARLRARESAIRRLFQPDHQRYAGVRPLNIYLMRLLYSLMAVFLSFDAWGYILSHQGPWQPYAAMVWSVWAAFATLAALGVLQPLRMLPLLLLEIFYKSLWLLLVAYPLWRDGALAGSPAEGMTDVFLPVIAVIAIVPWRYVLRHYVLGAGQ